MSHRKYNATLWLSFSTMEQYAGYKENFTMHARLVDTRQFFLSYKGLGMRTVWNVPTFWGLQDRPLTTYIQLLTKVYEQIVTTPFKTKHRSDDMSRAHKYQMFSFSVSLKEFYLC